MSELSKAEAWAIVCDARREVERVRYTLLDLAASAGLNRRQLREHRVARQKLDSARDALMLLQSEYSKEVHEPNYTRAEKWRT